MWEQLLKQNVKMKTRKEAACIRQQAANRVVGGEAGCCSKRAEWAGGGDGGFHDEHPLPCGVLLIIY
jgi:hypothetical protein